MSEVVTKGHVRQGDLLIRRIRKSDLPKYLRSLQPENNRLVVAHGEATGHHHAIAEEEGIQILAKDEKELTKRFIQIEKEHQATLEHEEHGAITLGPGIWEVVRQREYQEHEQPRYVYD